MPEHIRVRNSAAKQGHRQDFLRTALFKVFDTFFELSQSICSTPPTLERVREPRRHGVSSGQPSLLIDRQLDLDCLAIV